MKFLRKLLLSFLLVLLLLHSCLNYSVSAYDTVEYSDLVFSTVIPQDIYDALELLPEFQNLDDYYICLTICYDNDDNYVRNYTRASFIKKSDFQSVNFPFNGLTSWVEYTSEENIFYGFVDINFTTYSTFRNVVSYCYNSSLKVFDGMTMGVNSRFSNIRINSLNSKHVTSDDRPIAYVYTNFIVYQDKTASHPALMPYDFTRNIPYTPELIWQEQLSDNENAVFYTQKLYQDVFNSYDLYVSYNDGGFLKTSYDNVIFEPNYETGDNGVNIYYTAYGILNFPSNGKYVLKWQDIATGKFGETSELIVNWLEGGGGEPPVVPPEDSNQNIIDNQNKNTEDIINSNKETQKAIEEQHETQKGIWETIKDIFSFIVNLPVKLVELFLDMLKSLFIPENDFFTNYFNELNDWFGERLGFLYYPISLLIDILGRYMSIGNGNNSFTFPDILEPFTRQNTNIWW